MRTWEFDISEKKTIKGMPNDIVIGNVKLDGHKEEDDDGKYFEYNGETEDGTEISVYLQGEDSETMYIRCIYGDDEWIFEEFVPYEDVVKKIKECRDVIADRIRKDEEAGLKALFG